MFMSNSGMYSLHLGDCFEALSKLADNSIDLVFTSPPYNMNLRIRDGKYVSRQIVKELSTKYENYPDNLPIAEYFKLVDKVVSESLRVSDMLFLNVQPLTGNKPALYKLMGKYSDKVKEMIIWDKGHGQPAIGKGVLNSQFELILVFENSKPHSRAFSGANFDRGELSNVWRINREVQPVKGLGAAFPVKLAERVVSLFSNRGGGAGPIYGQRHYGGSVYGLG